MQKEEFEMMADKLRPLVLKVGRQFFGNKDDAEDVAQEVMMRLWTVRESIDIQRGTAEGLAIRMAKNYCISEMRRREVETTPIDNIQPQAIAPVAQTKMEAVEMREWLKHLVAMMPEASRRLLKMSGDDGLTTAEIARIIGLKEESVRVMLARARKRLIEEMKRYGKDK